MKKEHIIAVSFFLSLVTAVSVLIRIAWGNPLANPKVKSIIIDLTTMNKQFTIESLKEELSHVATELNKGEGLNTEYKFTSINNLGENESLAPSVLIPSEVGLRRIKTRQAYGHLKESFAQVRGKIKLAKSRDYKSSKYIEALNQALRSSDSLVVIGDFLIVDKENNFERGKFSDPANCGINKDLAIKKELVFKRISKPEMTAKEIAQVENWWIDCLGKDPFVGAL